MTLETRKILEQQFAQKEAREEDEKFSARLQNWLAHPGNLSRTFDGFYLPNPVYVGIRVPTSAYSTYKILDKNKAEMDARGVKNMDNYYHRKGMCEAAQNGMLGSAMGFAGGVAKEVVDLTTKPFKGKQKFGEIWNDSKKDMMNNFDGLSLGMRYPQRDCAEMLDNFDWRNNIWKKSLK